MMLIVSTHSFSQQITLSQPLTREDFLQKSKNQKTTAIVLAAGGGTLASIGLIEWSSGFSTGFDFSHPDTKAGSSEMNTGNALAITGGALALSSIPFFIASSKNKRRAMNATTSFKMETAPVIQHKSFVSRSYPALIVKINL